jgi:hypothetical protein
MSVVQPKDEAACKVATTMTGSRGGIWTATCASGTSCLVLTCTGTQKSGYNQLHYRSPWLIPSCTTAALQTATIDAMQVAVSTTGGGATEVKCAGSGAPASKFASGAFFMVSVFVSLVVASV